MADESRILRLKAGSSFKFDVQRWSQTDRIVAIATLVLFVFTISLVVWGRNLRVQRDR